MSTFANQLKSEIARLAKKEVRAETQALKKASAAYRGEIAALKRRIGGLETLVKLLHKGVGSAKVAKVSVEDSDTPRRFRVAGFAALRKKLGISAADMGKLLGVATMSCFMCGRHKPRSQGSFKSILNKSMFFCGECKPK